MKQKYPPQQPQKKQEQPETPPETTVRPDVDERGPLRRRLRDEIRAHKRLAALYVFLRLVVILVGIDQFSNDNFENVFLCLLTLVLFTLPSFVETNFHIDIPDAMEITILLFIFAAEILGEINSYYTVFPFWDTMLHTINGFLAAAIGFSLVELLNRNERFSLSLSPFYLALVAFCFSMTIGVLWEFFEFGVDTLLDKDMQKDYVITQINSVLLDPAQRNNVVRVPIESLYVNGQDWMALYGGYIDIGLHDTMKDLLVNFIGALVFSIIGYFYAKTNGRRSLAEKFIPTPR